MCVSTGDLLVERARLPLADAWLAASAGDFEQPLRATMEPKPAEPSAHATALAAGSFAVAGAAAPAQPVASTQTVLAPYSELPYARGGTKLEQVSHAVELGFDKTVSQAAFEGTLHPVLWASCAGCHRCKEC